MNLVKFSEYLGKKISINEDEVIVEWSEEGWNSLTVSERAKIDAEADLGWAGWHVGPLTEQDIKFPEDDEGTYTLIVYENEAIDEYIDSLAELDKELVEELDEDAWLTEKKKKYKPQKRRERLEIQKKKKRNKSKNRQEKKKLQIKNKKGVVRIKKKKQAKARKRVSGAKMATAHKLYSIQKK